MLLDGKVALITGAASDRGIGRAVARLFGRHGAKLAVTDRDAEGVRGAAEELGPGTLGLPFDVSDRASCFHAVETTVERFGRIDILVNVAGISEPGRIADIQPERIDAVFNVNVRGTMFMSQAAIPHMRAQRSGAIVCTSSIAAERGGGIFGGPHYAASKGAVLSLARSMARELGPDGVRVNAVCPGIVLTGIHAGRVDEEELIQRNRDNIPLRRLAQPEEIAGVCLFLASDLASYVTGATLDVNGGLHIH